MNVNKLTLLILSAIISAQSYGFPTIVNNSNSTVTFNLEGFAYPTQNGTNLYPQGQ